MSTGRLEFEKFVFTVRDGVKINKRAVMRCTCGRRNEFTLWSWSGDGKIKCKGCGKAWDYMEYIFSYYAHNLLKTVEAHDAVTKGVDGPKRR